MSGKTIQAAEALPDQASAIEERPAPASKDQADADFLESFQRLSHGAPRYRACAVRELAEHGAQAVPALSRALADEDLSVREAAARALGQLGTSEATVPLCAALKSNDLPTRAAAARALGEIGDQRVIPLLVDAMRGCFMRGSAWLQCWMGLMVAPTLTAIIVAWFISDIPSSLRWLFLVIYLTLICWGLYTSNRRSHSQVVTAISGAITKIAARHPSPELCRLVPELRSVSRDLFLQERSARKAARLAVAQIETHFELRPDLPVTASAPCDSGADFPIAHQPEGLPPSNSNAGS